MTPNQLPEFVELVTAAHGYYRQPVSEFLLSVWCASCQRYELEQIRGALTAHARDPERGQYPPKVADMVRLLEGTPTDRAVLAWGKVLDAIGRVGAWQDVVFDDPAIHAAVEDCGGWPKVCRGEQKDLSYLQHRFTEAHRAYVARGSFDYPRRLSGAADGDHEYTRRGLPAPRPALVGDQARCLEVFRGGAAARQPIAYLAADVLQSLALAAPAAPAEGAAA